MTVHTQPRNVSLQAARRLARLEACPGIVPQHCDEEALCGNCSFMVYRIADGTWRHQQNEIRAMRALVVDGAWPRG